MDTIEVNPMSAIISLKVSKRLPSFVEQKDIKPYLAMLNFPIPGKEKRIGFY